jgi:hypothetical protein
MRTIYLTSGDAVATVGSDSRAGYGPGEGIMLDSNGKTVGFDLYCEVQPNVWVHADKVPANVLAEERRRGQLTHGILYGGKLIDKLNVRNVYDRLVAAKVGLEMRADEYKGGKTNFQSALGNPLEQLSKQIEGLKQHLQELKAMDREADALELRLKKVEKRTREEQIKPEQVKLHPLDFLSDVTRAFSGRTLSTAALEQLAKAEQISDFVEESGNSLMLDPEKMRGLRRLLFQ